MQPDPHRAAGQNAERDLRHLMPLEPTLVDGRSGPLDPYVGIARSDWRMSLGESDSVTRSSRLEMSGANFHVATAHVGERMSYVHAVPRHVLYATLDGSTRHSFGRIGRREPVRKPDFAGALSFTPAGWERRVEIEDGVLRCAHIELSTDLLDGMTRRRSVRDEWSAPFNETDPKLLVMVSALAMQMASSAPIPGWGETLLLTIARRVASRFGQAPARADDGWLAPAALKRVIDRIDDGLDSPPALSVLAAEAGLGVSAFIRAFRGTTGRTPAAFALDRRLSRAEALVRHTPRTLGSIAAETGFASASHLVATFRQRRGFTPGVLR